MVGDLVIALEPISVAFDLCAGVLLLRHFADLAGKCKLLNL